MCVEGPACAGGGQPAGVPGPEPGQALHGGGLFLSKIGRTVCIAGLRIRAIFFGRIQQIRILKTGSPILLARTKNQFKHLNFFLTSNIFLLIFE